jgi:hypothetical protein
MRRCARDILPQFFAAHNAVRFPYYAKKIFRIQPERYV